MVNLFYRVTHKIWDFQNKTVHCTLMVLCSCQLFKFFIEKLYSVHTLMVPCSCQLFYFFIEKLYSVHSWFPAAAANFLIFHWKIVQRTLVVPCSCQLFKFFIEKLYSVHSWFPAAAVSFLNFSLNNYTVCTRGSLQLTTFFIFHWKLI